MTPSYDLTRTYLLSRHPAIASLPKPKWEPKHFKRVIIWGVLGGLLGASLSVACVVILWLVALRHEHARLVEEARAHQAELTAGELRREVFRIAEVYASSTSAPLDLAQKIQTVLDTAAPSQRTFFVQMMPEALRLQALYRIPASATLGVSTYESAYGTSPLAVQHYNFFGIKAASEWTGPKAQMPTTDSGVRTLAWFRSFPNVRQGVDGFAQFVAGKHRYHQAFSASTGAEFVAALATAGYCPDGDYSTRVAGLIQRHHYDLLDRPQALEPAPPIPVISSTVSLEKPW